MQGRLSTCDPGLPRVQRGLKSQPVFPASCPLSDALHQGRQAKGTAQVSTSVPGGHRLTEACTTPRERLGQTSQAIAHS